MADALLQAAAELSLPVAHLRLEEPELCQLYRHQLVLVRPDLHIAWRGTCDDDPGAIIDVARGARAHTEARAEQ